MIATLLSRVAPARWSERTTYIVRQGVVRYGVVIGLLVSLLGVVPDAGDFGEHWAALRIVGVVAASWVFWALVSGWIIGAFRWSLRGREAEGDGRRWRREGTSS